MHIEKPVLFVFRRDLRLMDNTALNAALKSGADVIPVFILDPRQVSPHLYRSSPGLQFMKESLIDLNLALKEKGTHLSIIPGIAEDTIPLLLKDNNCSALYFNLDYTPFSIKRDQVISERARSLNVQVFNFDDTLINEPKRVLKDDGKPYTVFTPYYKKALKIDAPLPEKLAQGSFYSKRLPNSISAEEINLTDSYDHEESIHGGRETALKILSQLEHYTNYHEERDIPSIKGTTRLGAHHKFGTISIRESLLRATQIFGRDSTLVRELYWRDFFTQIAFHFPHVFERSFNSAYDKVAWQNQPEWFNAWCLGNTGFPIVDAGMRELNHTGYMHNRVRMIVASFLTKDLLISWRLGEQYFAQKLVDYDPAVNNGSWQWAASTGCDAQPYFRIFNPWLQQERFDSECIYIKKWVPELRNLSAKEIHNLYQQRPLFLNGYPEPIVEHAKQKKLAEDMFRLAVK
jgi:deoxyribodipyrimidine photo-lyase